MQQQGSPEASTEIVSLSNIPDVRANIYPGCIVNGVRYLTKERDDRRTTQNSGVVVPGEHDDEVIDFYGRLSNVFELTFVHGYKVILFQCEWFDTNPKRRLMQEDYGFVSINTSTLWYANDPFVLATQATQVFYLDDYRLGSNWKVVQRVQQRNSWEIEENDEEQEEAINESFRDAYQEYRSSNINIAVQEDENLDELHIFRTDVEPDVVLNQDYNQNDVDDNLVSDDSSEGEDDTLVEYSSDSATSISDYDTDGEETL